MYGDYYLSEAEGIHSDHVDWEEVYDGWQLVIRDVENLTIRSEQGATILAEPRYDSPEENR